MRATVNICVLFTFLINWEYTSADLMDLTSEAICAARCFMLFTTSLTGPDKLFLQQRPDLTQPHCINQKGSCALCLDVCQWPRAQTLRCSESCTAVKPVDENDTIPKNLDITCMAACEFAHDQYARRDLYSRGRIQSSCPLSRSWPITCKARCQTDADCSGIVHQKCCANAACSALRDSDANRSVVHVCMPGIMPGVGSPVPSVPSRPMVKQIQAHRPTKTGQVTEEGPSADDQQYQLELDWLNYYNASHPKLSGSNITQYPVVFLVQLRQFHDPSFALDLGNLSQASVDGPVVNNLDQFFDEWRNLVWTTKLGAVLSDLRPGTWYQFRLIAISVGGYGGWSEPSKPIRVLTRPVPPSTPRNMTEMRIRIFENHLDLTIRWDPPKLGNLPLKKYQVSWRKYYGFHGEDRSSLTEYEANVPGDKRTYTIQGLQPATAYKIEVKAISIFEDREMESHPATLYITTPQLPPRQTSREITNQNNSGDTCRCDGRTDSAIRIGQPFWENMQLKTTLFLHPEQVDGNSHYVTEWSPRVCIESAISDTQGAYFAQTRVLSGQQMTAVELSNLSLQCHYKVTVAERNRKHHEINGRPRSWSTCFCTPSCQNVPVVSGPGPRNCSASLGFEHLKPIKVTYKLFSSADEMLESQIPHLLGPRSFDYVRPESRPRIKRTSKEVSDNFHAMVSWTVEEASRKEQELMRSGTLIAQNEQTVRGVRVTWGPRIYEPVRLEAYHNGLKPLVDPEKTQSKVLESRTSSVLLRELRPDTLYIVTVQLIGDRMDGPASTVFFFVPTTHTRSATTHVTWLFSVTVSVLAARYVYDTI